jgi:hypothetical protein
MSMDRRLRATAVLALLAVLVVVGAQIDRHRAGLERSYFAFLVLLTGPVFHLGLAARGRSEPLPRAVLGFVLLAFSGLTRRPFAPWGLVAAAIGTFWLALPVARGAAAERASALEEAAVAALAAGAYAFLWFVADGDLKNYAVAGLLALQALEAWGPRAERTVEAARRRLATFALLGAAVEMYGHERPWVIFMEPENVFLVLGATGVFAACAEASEAR